MASAADFVPTLPPEVDGADTGFMIVCTALVMLMTAGLGIFYAGLVLRKNSVNMMFMNFVALGPASLFWTIIGFALAFGPTQGGFIANGKHAMLTDVGMDASPDFGPTIPFLVFFAYQMMFAIITPLLITGAFADRFTFHGFLIWEILWTLIVYIPQVHWVFGGGFMMTSWKVADFGGGLTVHAAGGAGALACALWFGDRAQKEWKSHSIPLVAIGTGLLWFGWFGFNGGSSFAVSGQAAVAFANTHISGAAGLTTWTAIEWLHEGKPSLVGSLFGGVAGLAVISAACGHVQPWAALLIGITVAILSYSACQFQFKMGFDDALNVWAVHWISGATGIIGIGLLGDAQIGGVNGAIHGNARQLGIQIAGLAVVSLWSFCLTYAILVVMEKIGIQVRATDEVQLAGLDKELHDESSYDDDAGVVEKIYGVVAGTGTIAIGKGDGYNPLIDNENPASGQGSRESRKSFEVLSK